MHVRAKPYVLVIRRLSSTPAYLFANDVSISITVVPKVADTSVIDTNSVYDPFGIASMAMYPNPTNGDVWMTLRTLDAGMLEVNLLDMAGRRVQSLHAAQHPAGTLLLNIVPKVPAGIYLVQVRSGGTKRTERLVVE